jgi:hypothetical protein
MELNSKMELVPITIKTNPGSVFVETTLSQSNESKLSGPTMHKTLMTLPRLPAGIKTKKPDDDEITILSSTVESESERRKRKKEKSIKQRDKMLSYILEHLEKHQPDPNPPHVAPQIKPPPNLHNRSSTIIPTRMYRSPEPIMYNSLRSLTPTPSSHSDHTKSPLHSRSWLEHEVSKLRQQQLRARHSLRGQGSRPQGRQNQNPKRPPVFYQDHQISTRDSITARGISKKSRPSIGQKKRLMETELTQYREHFVCAQSVQAHRSLP